MAPGQYTPDPTEGVTRVEDLPPPRVQRRSRNFRRRRCPRCQRPAYRYDLGRRTLHETEADFAELEGFVADTRFDHVGVFTYSHEEGTRAYGFADDVPAVVKRRRRSRLMARQKRIVAAAQKSRIGSDVRVLVDGRSPEHELVLQGRLEGQAPDIDPMVFLTDCDPAAYAPGELIRATVVGSKGYDLIARPATDQGQAT